MITRVDTQVVNGGSVSDIAMALDGLWDGTYGDDDFGMMVQICSLGGLGGGVGRSSTVTTISA